MLWFILCKKLLHKLKLNCNRVLIDLIGLSRMNRILQTTLIQQQNWSFTLINLSYTTHRM